MPHRYGLCAMGYQKPPAPSKTGKRLIIYEMNKQYIYIYNRKNVTSEPAMKSISHTVYTPTPNQTPLAALKTSQTSPFLEEFAALSLIQLATNSRKFS